MLVSEVKSNYKETSRRTDITWFQPSLAEYTVSCKKISLLHFLSWPTSLSIMWDTKHCTQICTKLAPSSPTVSQPLPLQLAGNQPYIQLAASTPASQTLVHLQLASHYRSSQLATSPTSSWPLALQLASPQLTYSWPATTALASWPLALHLVGRQPSSQLAPSPTASS